MTTWVWFRLDLRVHDHSALHHACKKYADVKAVYFWDQQAFREHKVAKLQQAFIREHLLSLNQSLAELGIPFTVVTVKRTSQIKTWFSDRCEPGSAIYCNKQYEHNECVRDQGVLHWCEHHGVEFSSFHDATLLPPGAVQTGKGTYYSVYSPFKRACYQYIHQQPVRLLKKPQQRAPINPEELTLPVINIDEAKLAHWPIGETSALARLKKFVQKRIEQYDASRDMPSIDGTSVLSPYLAIGVLSPRQCFIAAINANNGVFDSGNKAIQIWVQELLWRDFYKHVVVGFPWVCKHHSFNREYDNFTWKNNEGLFKAWCAGKTGIPIIDAAMRQLLQTGWMHNRLRMVVAMFLTKNCLIDWRWGEEFFLKHLIDGDFASNNGGWQWSASTGTDAAPYFRIMNPCSQASRFDPEAVFITKYLPELKNAPIKAIIHANDLARFDYPEPVVDLKQSRAEAIEVFKLFNR